jgi:hypothetical protein
MGGKGESITGIQYIDYSGSAPGNHLLFHGTHTQNNNEIYTLSMSQ